MGNSAKKLRKEWKKDKHKSSTLKEVTFTAEELKNLYTASFDYVAQQADELQLKAGDRVLVDSNVNIEVDSWWQAKNVESDEHGLVPGNYLKKGVGVNVEGWRDVQRQDAVRLLLAAGLPEGTFIVRPSAKPVTGFSLILALSVRYKDKTRQNTYLVKHYQIKSRNGTSNFYIHESRMRETIAELLQEYRNGGLCCKLTQPCPVSPPVVQFKDIEVNRDCLTMIKKLGNGGFGDVWLAKWNNILDVAVKSLKANVAMTPETFLEEAKIMHKIRHDKMVTILGVCTEATVSGDEILIITEFMENGALLDYLRKLNSPTAERPTLDTLFDMVYQIADGMSYLEEKRLVHRDLRAANVLVGKSNFVKVADFGLARLVQDDETYQPEAQGNKFPVKWTAPEAMFENRFTTKSDVWSFGVLMYEILTLGSTVYVCMSNRDVMEYVKNPRNRLPQPQTPWMNRNDQSRISIVYKEFMLKCWDASPDDRPSFDNLKNDFENIDILLEQQYG